MQIEDPNQRRRKVAANLLARLGECDEPIAVLDDAQLNDGLAALRTRLLALRDGKDNEPQPIEIETAGGFIDHCFIGESFIGSDE